MFISEEDVTAIHSSTIGSINEEDLFYLMSRGISYNDSVKLIIKGRYFLILILIWKIWKEYLVF